jgi:hypothetical protein
MSKEKAAIPRGLFTFRKRQNGVRQACSMDLDGRQRRFISTSSAGVNRTVAAPMFSNICAICVVPGIGTIQGFCAISQASEICAGVACFRTAQLLAKSTSARLWGRFSGENLDSILRMSPSANRIFASMAPVRKPTPNCQMNRTLLYAYLEIKI